MCIWHVYLTCAGLSEVCFDMCRIVRSVWHLKMEISYLCRNATICHSRTHQMLIVWISLLVKFNKSFIAFGPSLHRSGPKWTSRASGTSGSSDQSVRDARADVGRGKSRKWWGRRTWNASGRKKASQGCTGRRCSRGSGRTTWLEIQCTDCLFGDQKFI